MSRGGPAQPGANLLRLIESFCRTNKMADSKFGREAAKDPRLVYDLRNGRGITAKREQRVRDFIAGYRA